MCQFTDLDAVITAANASALRLESEMSKSLP